MGKVNAQLWRKWQRRGLIKIRGGQQQKVDITEDGWEAMFIMLSILSVSTHHRIQPVAARMHQELQTSVQEFRVRGN